MMAATAAATATAATGRIACSPRSVFRRTAARGRRFDRRCFNPGFGFGFFLFSFGVAGAFSHVYYVNRYYKLFLDKSLVKKPAKEYI
jgi:hypothetical protein